MPTSQNRGPQPEPCGTTQILFFSKVTEQELTWQPAPESDNQLHAAASQRECQLYHLLATELKPNMYSQPQFPYL